DGLDSVRYCVGSSNDTITTTGLGTFSMLNSTTGVTATQLVNSGNNTINIHTGTTGEHTVLYNSTTGCPVSDTLKVVIDSSFTGLLVYQGGPYCVTQMSSVPVFDLNDSWGSFPPGGFFTAFPSTGLDLDGSNGNFIPSNSTPGTYVVSYHAPPDSCWSTATATVEITDVDSAVFDYIPGSYCLNDSNPSPVITNLPIHIPTSQRFFISSPAGMDLDSLTGEINLSNSNAGDYEVEYRITTGSCVVNKTDSVFLLPLPNVSFTLPDTFCTTGQPTLTPQNPMPAGTQSWSNWTGQVDIHPTTGVINLTNSTPGGPYPIRLLVDDGTCSDSSVHMLHLLGIDSLDIQYPKNYVCKTEANPIPLISAGVAGGTFYESTGMLVFADAMTGEINVQASMTGTYQIEYVLPPTHCGDTVVIYNSFTVDQAPLASFTIDSTYFCHGMATQMNILHANIPFSFWAYDGGTQLQVSNPPHNFMLLGSMIPGQTYRLESITQSGVGCRDTFELYLDVFSQQPSGLSYLRDTICLNENYPTPLLTGVGGGFFTGDSALGTVVDSMTGIVNLDSSGQGQHAVYYTSPGPCPTTSVDTFGIQNGFNGFFRLEKSATCNNPDTLVPLDTLAFNVPGLSRWFATHVDTGSTDSLAFVPGSGDIDLINSIITGRDTFIVSHVVGGQGNCLDTVNQQFVVHEFDLNLSIQYPADTFCPIGGDTLPDIIANFPGRVIPSPGLALTNDSTGSINLSASADGREYIIWYVIEDGLCGEIATDTIFIRTLDLPGFLFPSNFVCHEDTIIQPLTLQTQGGNFSWESQNVNNIGNLVFVDSSAGLIDIGASVPGPYLITYETLGECSNSETQPFTIIAKPEIDSLEIVPDTSICLNEQISLTVPISGIVTWFVNGTAVTNGQTYSTSNLSGTNYVEAVISINGCTDTAGTGVLVNEKPLVDYVQFPNVTTGDVPIDIILGTTQNNTHINWWVRPDGDFEVDSLMGQTDTIDVGETTQLINGVELTSDFTPVSLVYYFTPIASGCEGDEDSLAILINPNEQQIFISELLTPNGDTRNDTWEIHYLPDIDPSLYMIDVYNRAGARVYTMEDISSTWDGSGLPDGVYWWVLKLEDGTPQFAGGLTIRRR
ncbi:MAG: gliding motility-associated C-terminal domain-containing protein, partial [Bacteroidota bacterium]